MTLPIEARLAIESALSERFGGSVQLATDAQSFPHSRVFRCTLQSSPATMPRTIIVRLPRAGDVRGGRTGLRREQAALEYLTTLGSEIAPRYLAGDDAAGFLASDDLGEPPSLLDVLLSDDWQAARQAFLSFARGLGRLHAQTLRKPGDVLPPFLTITPVPVREHWQQVQAAVLQQGLPAPSGVDADIDLAHRLLSEPGAPLALSSGDISVVNCKISGDTARIFDFEDACFRHPFVDAVVLRYPYPTGGPPWRLPHEITLAGETAYRAELARSWPPGANDGHYEHGMAAACAAWTILRLARLPKVNTGPDRDSWMLLPSGWTAPPPNRSRRRQLVAILETCIAFARRADGFKALTTWCERLTGTLRERWPEAHEALPIYPAFSNNAAAD